MFHIPDEQLCHLAHKDPDTLGLLMTSLAIPTGLDLTTVVFEPGPSWQACEPGPRASAEQLSPGDLQSYKDETGTIIVTCVVTDGCDDFEIFVEGPGWLIHADHLFGGWMTVQ